MPRKRDDVVGREHDFGPSCEPGLGYDVDRRRLQLDQEHVCLDVSSSTSKRRAIGEVPGDMNDVGAVLGASAPPSPRPLRAARCRSTRPSVHGRSSSVAAGGSSRRPRSRRRRPREPPRRSAPTPTRPPPSSRRRDRREAGERRSDTRPRRRALVPTDDGDRSVGGDRWQRRAAAVEDDEIGAELGSHPRALEDVRRRRPHPRARLRSAGNPPSRRRRAPPSRGDRMRHGVRLSRARRARRGLVAR